jgi:6-pyruvoyltetrahydropterin/6-carboxytetrahydropterin synthase
MTYRLGLQRDFEARHYLIGGDWGVENVEHAHPYRVEWILEGSALDQHGYLVDLVAVEGTLEATLRHFRGAVLNDLAEFAGLNPSLENFARILAVRLAGGLDGRRLAQHVVRLWESPTAWASFRQRL